MCQGRRLIPCRRNMSRDGGGRNYLSSRTRVGDGGGRNRSVCVRVIMVMGNNNNTNKMMGWDVLASDCEQDQD